MLKTWLSDATIMLRQSVETWPQALAICAQPLLKAGVIEPAYVKAIVEQHQGWGPTMYWLRVWRCRTRDRRRERKA